MALPQLNTLTFELTVPSTKEKIKFRPFLVKEQKLLLMAQETGTNKDMLQAVCNIVKTCTFGKIDKPEDLLTSDIEYIFLYIRGKSIGEEFKVNVLCPDDKKTYAPVTIMLNDIKLEDIGEKSGDIKLTDDIGMTLRFPSVKDIMGINYDDPAVKVSMDVIKKTVINIYDSNEVYEEFTDKEIMDFVDSLNTEQFDLVQEFYNNAPKLIHKVMVTNPTTGVDSEVTIEGLQSFLG